MLIIKYSTFDRADIGSPEGSLDPSSKETRRLELRNNLRREKTHVSTLDESIEYAGRDGRTNTCEQSNIDRARYTK